MSYLLLFLVLHCTATPPSEEQIRIQGQAYEQKYAASVAKTHRFFQTHHQKWHRQARQLGLSKAEFFRLSAVLFPEITRYMGYQGFLESAYMLMTGDDWIARGVSIGPLQMKAAFVSTLSKARYPNPKAQQLAHRLQDLSPDELKQTLKSPHSCFEVACLFFLHQKAQGASRNLDLLAMRFNAGLMSQTKRLPTYLSKKQFPDGPGHSNQFNFAVLARYYFKQLSSNH